MSDNKTFRKYAVSTMAAATAAAGVVPAAVSADSNVDFPDVSDTNDHRDAILELANSGVINGYADGTFRPHEEVTRSQVAVMLAKHLGIEAPANIEAALADYTDVDADHRYATEIAAVSNAKVFYGNANGEFNPYSSITRQQMATVLVQAFDLDELEGADDHVDINTDSVSKDHVDNVQILANLGITQANDDFRGKEHINRGQFASFLKLTQDVVDESERPDEVEGIESVSAINDTTVEVEFGKAVDKDFIREAEKNGEYFRVFLQGDSASSGDAIKSDSISFSRDGKTAEFTLGDKVNGDAEGYEIESGKKYSVALTDGDNRAASVLYEFGPTTLISSASKPEFEVSTTSEKITVKYGEKMSSDALSVENYTVYDDGGKELGDLSEFVEEDIDGKWVDATKKTSVEFTLDKDAEKRLNAGKTYRLHVDEAVETDDNKSLSDKDRIIKVTTPSVNEAKPKAVTARTESEDTVVVSFDQDIDTKEVNVNVAQAELKTATGKTIDIEDVEAREGADNEVVITTKNKDLEVDETYKVSLPANAVTNAVFPNASSDAVKDLRSKAQENKEIKSVKAELKANAKDREQADLHLEFDQRPDKSVFESNNEDIKIVDGSDEYTLTGDTNAKVKYTGDKTVVIENVEAAFEDDSEGFVPKKGDSYKFEIGAGELRTAAFEDTGVTNQSKLTANINGVSVSAPREDSVTLVSENEIKVNFKEDISNISAEDVNVKGYELYNNGRFASDVNLTADDIKTSVSGKTLTIKTNGDVLFNTDLENSDIEIKANSFTSKDSKVANEKVTIDNSFEEDDFVDNAQPVIVGASAGNNAEDVEFTFTEEVEFKGDGENIAKLFSVKKGANDSVGSTATVSSEESNELTVTFNKEVFDADTVLSRVEVKYAGGNTYYIRDTKGNEAKDATIKGLKGTNPVSEDDNSDDSGDDEDETDGDN